MNCEGILNFDGALACWSCGHLLLRKIRSLRELAKYKRLGGTAVASNGQTQLRVGLGIGH